jgi:hypothetical protein
MVTEVEAVFSGRRDGYASVSDKVLSATRKQALFNTTAFWEATSDTLLDADDVDVEDDEVRGGLSCADSLPLCAR